jgi:hypothetical protein
VITLIQKIKGKIDYLTRKITLFKWDNVAIKSDVINSLFDYNYNEFSSMLSLQSIEFHYDTLELEHRFLQQHVLCILQDSNNEVMSYGWYNNSGAHYLGELDLMMNLSQEYSVLYDFHTYEQYRGKGLYPYLLQCICRRDDTNKIIYAFPENIQSCKGILKANFKVVGTLSGMNKKNYSKMITR